MYAEINNMKTFDSLDRTIFRILDTEGALSVSDVAKRVRRGRDTVAYRLRRMEEDGVLRGVEPILDPGALGLGLFKTYVSFSNSPASVEKVLKALRSHPQVYCAARAYGRWDLMFNMVARDAREFARLRHEVLGRETAGIREMESAVFTEMVYFNRKYLGAPPCAWTALVGSKSGEFDDPFRRVLRRMCADARATEVNIAKAEKLTPIVVRTRREQAEARGVILGYRARFDRAAFELSSYKLHIQLRDHSTESVLALRTFAKKHPYVAQFMLHIGGWPCEMNIEAHDNRHAAQIIDELREQHGERLGLIDISLYDRDTFAWGCGMDKLSNNSIGMHGESFASAV